MKRRIRRMLVDLLNYLDRRSPTGFFSQDSGAWAHTAWSRLVSPKGWWSR